MSPLRILDLVCVSPWSKCLCVRALPCSVLKLDITRGCAADLGTSRWQDFAAGCDLECHSEVGDIPREPGRIRSVFSQDREPEPVVGFKKWCREPPTWEAENAKPASAEGSATSCQ